jgi:predicted nucleotidyltransferase component of viral defense system
MITPKEISKRAAENKVSERQIEKDYILTWILAGVAGYNVLEKRLVFKGGTVLKKCYFEDYRFSEDLDFTLTDENLTNEMLIECFRKVFEWVKEETNMLLQFGKINVHKDSGSSQFFIDYVGPLGGKIESRSVKADITRGEILVYKPEIRKIFTDYSDMKDLSASIMCYPLSEILIEKMAALMGRTEPRDLYDFWHLTEIERMDIKDHWDAFEQKAKTHKQDPKGFSNKIMAKEEVFRRDWVTKLKHQVNDLKKYEDTFREAKRHLKL